MNDRFLFAQKKKYCWYAENIRLLVLKLFSIPGTQIDKRSTASLYIQFLGVIKNTQLGQLFLSCIHLILCITSFAGFQLFVLHLCCLDNGRSSIQCQRYWQRKQHGNLLVFFFFFNLFFFSHGLILVYFISPCSHT